MCFFIIVGIGCIGGHVVCVYVCVLFLFLCSVECVFVTNIRLFRWFVGGYVFFLLLRVFWLGRGVFIEWVNYRGWMFYWSWWALRDVVIHFRFLWGAREVKLD